MTFPTTCRLLEEIDLAMMTRAIRQVCREVSGTDPEVGTTTGQARLDELYRQVSLLIPSEGERAQRLREVAQELLPQVIEERVEQLTNAEAVDLQFEAGDILRMSFSSTERPEGVHLAVHAMLVEQLAKSGRLTKLA